jgi:hypothetical protein
MLPEDVAEPGNRHESARDKLGEGLAGTHGRELVGIADQHHAGMRAHGTQQRDKQLEVGHRALIDDQQIALQRVIGVVLWPLPGDPAKGRVHRTRAQPRRLAHAHGGASGRSDKHHARPLRNGTACDRTDTRGLSRPRAARDQRKVGLKGMAKRLGLRAVGFKPGRGNLVLAGSAQPLRGLKRAQLRYPLRQLGLEPGGLRAVDPAVLALDLAALE